MNKTATCWLWTGTKYRGGYGHFGRWIDNRWKMYKAHRYSYEYFNADIPEGYMVCHRCDTPACVNPKHLFVGTAQDNMKDKMDKGRFSIIRNPRYNNLTKEYVDMIRATWEENKGLGVTQREVAELYGISPAQFSRVVNNKIWKDEA